jgi:hypothetical protein|tara:strand:+ start:1335 stop:1460 length:126 start_codon:yes stop_codon:yes gene_type:complete
MTHLSTADLRDLLDTLAASLHPSAAEQADTVRDLLALRGDL